MSSEQVRTLVKAVVSALGLYYGAKFLSFLRWRSEMNRRFKGPKPNFFLGNLGDLTAAGGFTEKFFETLHSAYGKVARFWIMTGGLNVSVTDVSDIQELYRKARSRPKETELFLGYLGKENLLFTHGPMVKKLRLRYGKMVSTKEALLKVHDATIEHFESAIAEWGGDVPVNVHAKLGPILYDIMGEVLFGSAWSSTEEGPRMMKLHLYLIHECNRWAFYPIAPWWNADYRKFVQTIKDLRALCGSMISKRRAEIKANPAEYADDLTALNMLCTDKDADGTPFFSQARAISTLIGFINGAYDTTHATSFWIFFRLAKHPEVQRKLIREIDAAIGKNKTPSLEELRDLKYLHAVIQESMRIRATVPVNQRVNMEEDIVVGGNTIPKGCNVNIPMFLTFRDSKYFGEDTDKFIPERFVGASDAAKKARNSWIAFGAHARMCVGFTFGLAELKAIFVTVLQRYTIELENADQEGAFMIEAGVNQPNPKFNFCFKARR